MKEKIKKAEILLQLSEFLEAVRVLRTDAREAKFQEEKIFSELFGVFNETFNKVENRMMEILEELS